MATRLTGTKQASDWQHPDWRDVFKLYLKRVWKLTPPKKGPTRATDKTNRHE